jgi:hypothetical protein
VIAAFRAMIARWLRGGNDGLVKGLAGSAGDAVRLGEEELDGAGGFGGFVARPVSQRLELGGTGRQVGDTRTETPPPQWSVARSTRADGGMDGHAARSSARLFHLGSRRAPVSRIPTTQALPLPLVEEYRGSGRAGYGFHEVGMRCL